MPRLGSGGTPGNDGGGTPRRPAAAAYPSAGRGGILSNVMLLLAFTFILRNVFFNDYRSEEIKQLEAMGKSPEEIEKFVPKTATERRAYLKKKKTGFNSLIDDVELLKKQVSELREKMDMDDKTSPDDHAGDPADESESKSDAAEKQEKEEETGEETETTERRAKETPNRHGGRSQHSKHDHHETGGATKDIYKTRHVEKSEHVNSTLRKKKTISAAKAAVVTKKTSPAKKKKKVKKKKVASVTA